MSFFPPLGLAVLASLCSEFNDIQIVDDHVEEVDLQDNPYLACIETYITNQLNEIIIF